VGLWSIFTVATFKPQKTMLEDVILMRKCGICHIITASSIIGTRSKNGVLGGDKQLYYTNLPLPRLHPLCSPSTQSHWPGSSNGGGGAHQRNAADGPGRCSIWANGADVVFTDTGHRQTHDDIIYCTRIMLRGKN